MNSNEVFPAIKNVIRPLLSKLPRVIFSCFFLSWVLGHFGSFYWRFEMASHFQLQYLFGSLAFGALFAAMKQWRWLGAALFCALISVVSVIPWHFPMASAWPQTSPHRLRLLLSNVYARNSSHSALVDLALQDKPDLVFVQEVTRQWADALDRLRVEYPHGVILEGGVASLSRLPLLKAADAGTGDYNGPGAEIQLNAGDRILQIINVHTPAPIDKRSLQLRNEHLDVIADRMNNLPNPKILIGDLNVTMWSPYYRRLIERTGLINAREGFGVLPTWPTYYRSSFLMIPIDHCLVSEDIRVINIRTGAHIGSDHLPLIVDIEISGRR
jgi:endonuclease/exonuclease/phosphatase (EEP) superfamily protein YafD